MAIDGKSILNAVQQKIALVDSSTSTRELYDLYKTAKSLGGGSSIDVYNTEDDLPMLLDATPDNENLAYVRTSATLYSKTNQGWKKKSGGESVPFSGLYKGYQARGTGPAQYKFAFSNWTNFANIADIRGLADHATFSSSSNGYTVGGFNSPSLPSSLGELELATPTTYTRSITKFPFASEANVVNAGTIQDAPVPPGTPTQYWSYGAGFSHKQLNYGWAYMGQGTNGFSVFASGKIFKYPYANETLANLVANANTNSVQREGASGPEYGYLSGGTSNPTSGGYTQYRSRFSFYTDIAAALYIELSDGAPSTNHIYEKTVTGFDLNRVGHVNLSNPVCMIEMGGKSTTPFAPSPGASTFVLRASKMPWATEVVTGSQTLELWQQKNNAAGISAIDYGYVCNGQDNGPSPLIPQTPLTQSDTAIRIPFSTGIFSTELPDLIQVATTPGTHPANGKGFQQ